jgi:hypothetical protein
MASISLLILWQAFNAECLNYLLVWDVLKSSSKVAQ